MLSRREFGSTFIPFSLQHLPGWPSARFTTRGNHDENVATTILPLLTNQPPLQQSINEKCVKGSISSRSNNEKIKKCAKTESRNKCSKLTNRLYCRVRHAMQRHAFVDGWLSDLRLLMLRLLRSGIGSISSSASIPKLSCCFVAVGRRVDSVPIETRQEFHLLL